MPRVYKILVTVAVILLSISAIFFFSEQSGTDSHTESLKVAKIAATGILRMTPSVNCNSSEINKLALLLDYPIRKLAHLFIYFMLGFIAYAGTRFALENKFRPLFALIIILLIFIVACADEINQYYSVGRGAAFSDVIIDTIGGIMGIYFFHILKDFASHVKQLFHK